MFRVISLMVVLLWAGSCKDTTQAPMVTAKPVAAIQGNSDGSKAVRAKLLQNASGAFPIVASLTLPNFEVDNILSYSPIPLLPERKKRMRELLIRMQVESMGIRVDTVREALLEMDVKEEALLLTVGPIQGTIDRTEDDVRFLSEGEFLKITIGKKPDASRFKGLLPAIEQCWAKNTFCLQADLSTQEIDEFPDLTSGAGSLSATRFSATIKGGKSIPLIKSEIDKGIEELVQSAKADLESDPDFRSPAGKKAAQLFMEILLGIKEQLSIQVKGDTLSVELPLQFANAVYASAVTQLMVIAIVSPKKKVEAK